MGLYNRDRHSKPDEILDVYVFVGHCQKGLMLDVYIIFIRENQIEC